MERYRLSRGHACQGAWSFDLRYQGKRRDDSVFDSDCASSPRNGGVRVSAIGLDLVREVTR